jgi:AAA15 family ATPase/GTPase
MVKIIKIENFKSIQSLEIELGRVNVFIGENGCGKTNILEAITMGGALAADKLDNVFLLNRGVRVTEPKFMKSGFEKENEKDIFISFFSVVSESDDETGYPGEYSYFDCYLENFKNSKWADSRWGDNNRLEAMLERLHYRDNASKILRIDGFQVFCPENYILRKYESESYIGNLGVNGEGLLGMLEKLYLENKLNEIKENLALIDWFDDFEIVNDAFRGSYLRIKDRFLNEEMTYSSFKSVNEGFLFLLFYLTLFISEYTPKFFAIDNIDNALNPRLCQKLIEVLVKLAKKHDKQVIFTTHNPSILDGLDLDDPEQKLYAIFRNKSGHTKAKPVEAPKAVNGQVPVRLSEAFLRGYIGGLPKNI